MASCRLTSLAARVRPFATLRSWTCLVALTGLVTMAPAEPAAPVNPADRVDFSAEIRPILSEKCASCHGPDESSRKAKLRLDLRDEAIRERKDGAFAIKPGDPEHSELIRRIISTDPDEVMPPPKTGHTISPREAKLLRRWIAQGAPYTGHWAFTKPQRPALPVVPDPSWVRNPIDYFILARLGAAGLRPSAEADRYTLIRRLSFDLTGLPPTPAEVDEFVQDPSPDAYERVVDRLLKSPAFGERWARVWLDLARYADSAGYGSDPLRLNIWPYRDWVINAFNRNLPYDEFTLDQLAGDLLDNPSEEQLAATAFHRNTMTNTEGGTDDEEWRVAAVKDRAGVTAQAWMGLTMGCAQCHSHKFDPISQREYYQFYALFNQTEDNDQPDERPTMPYPTRAQREEMARLKARIGELETELQRNDPDVQAELATWEKARAASGNWTPLALLDTSTSKGAKLTAQADGSLLASGTSPDKETYTLTLRNPLTNLSALRLEVLPDESLPGKGPGRSSGGNFVLDDVQVVFVPEKMGPASARYVRIELPGAQRILHLAEVQVFSGGANVATNGTATQSSTDYEAAARLAIDGNTGGEFFKSRSVTHNKIEDNPWWEVDLGRELPLDSVIVWNRTDGETAARLDGFRLLALNAQRQAVWSNTVAKAPSASGTYALNGERPVALQNATADFSQTDFEVTKAVDGSRDGKSGWAVGSQTGRPHVAVFETAANLEAGVLRVKLVQNYGQQHTLGRFRLSATTQPRPVRQEPTNITALLQIAANARSESQRRELISWFRPYAAVSARLTGQIAKTRSELAAIRPAPLPVMRELPANKRRVSHLFNKGNFLDPGDVVSPGVPAAFGALPAGAPTNRLGVALWLASPENPLTARVAANRFWSQLFGGGLVETEEDFGTQGALPSHPELLDWLAVEFRDNGWNIKGLLKTIVTSATYRQSARVTPELLEKDPRDRLYSRYPRRRLDAEMVRDQALALSGLLSHKLGGPSVYPPQPDGLWKAAFNGERTYSTSKGEDRYRRGLYTVWRRTVPYPSMSTFDAPSRETCTLRRLPTNTPLQAFVTMNDPVFVECAQALGRRLARDGATPADRIRRGLRLVLARPADDVQVQALVRLYEAELAHYSADEPDALKLATEPLGPLPAGLSAPEAAAWTVVANVLLNLDGVLTKG